MLETRTGPESVINDWNPLWEIVREHCDYPACRALGLHAISDPEPV